MASRNAKINIVVDGLRQVQALEKSLRSISNLADKVNGRGGGSKGTQQKDQRLKEEIQIERILNNIATKRNQLFQINSKDAKVSAIKNKFTRAENLALEGNVLESQKQLAIGTKRLTQLKGETAEINRQTAELKEQQAIANQGISASGPFSRLSDRQSRDREGKRTFMNNRFVGGMAGLLPQSMQPTRGFDFGSAAIGGGFPLLFGGGPLQAAAGALGGGIGGMFGKGGGFAGSIAATAIVQTIQKAVTAISELGQALGPFTQNTEAVVSSLGLQNSVQEAQIKLIEQVEGKTAAFNAAMKLMANDIGQRGVDALKQFGESSRILSSQFTLAITKLQAFAAGVANFVLRITGLENRLKKADAGRIVSGAAARGNTQALGLMQRQKQIDEMGSRGGEGKTKEALQDQLDLEKELFAVREAQKTKLAEITLEHDQAVKKSQEELELKRAVDRLLKTGISESLAKEIAQREQLKNKTIEELDQIRDKLRLERAALDSSEENKQREKEIKQLLEDILKLKEKITGETNKTVEGLKNQGTEIKKVKVTKKEVADLLANEMTNALMGLIEGTKSLGESLASIAKSLAKMFLNAAFQNIFNNLFQIKGEQGLYNRAGGFKAFQQGGVVSSPMLGLIGEGGESEYVIPASKMDGAMARYSAGARGGAVIPGGSHESGTVAGGSGNAIVEYTGPVLNFNGDEYVPKSAVPDIIGAATKQGAVAGKAQVLGTLRNSRSQRASLGL